jgi:putative transposase
MAPSPPNAPDTPQRKRPAHPPPVYACNRPVILFVTVCLAERVPVLANADVQAALHHAWTEADRWRVGYYVIMPDHVHWFCAPGCDLPPGIRDWVRFWKSRVSRMAPELRNRWLPDCWDTQMRSQEQYLQKLDYVGANPVRKGLVAEAVDWPFQGHLGELRWTVG